MRITKAVIESRLEHRIKDYEVVAKRTFDFGNGTAQIPRGNMDAAVAYGQIRELLNILDN